jgi:diguanylate cyclase (GGDEF)-like protein/PAS domain S-box-containing protein
MGDDSARSRVGPFEAGLLAAVPDGVIAYSADGRCLFANEAAAELLGLSRDHLLSHPYDQLTLWESPSFKGRGREAVPLDEATTWEGSFDTPGAKARWLRLRQSWAQTEAGLVLLIVVSDITEYKQREKILSLSQASVDCWSDPVYWVSPSGRILFVNDAGCRRYGYTREEMLGMNVREITVGMTEEQWAARWQDIRGRRVSVVETTHKTREGTTFPVEVTANYFVHDGKEYNVAFVRDTTERKKTEAALHVTKLSADKAADLIHWIDSSGRLLYVSDSVCARHGYSRDELANMTIFDLDPLQTPASWEKHWRLIKKRGSLVTESVHKTRNGELFPVEVTVNFVESDGMEYNFAFARDVSERKQQERELISAKDELERANGRLEQEVHRTQELNKHLRDAQEILLYQARVDPLTGASNRWAVLSRLREEEARAGREGAALAVGIVDVDHFKRVNDRYGHVIGDKVLTEVAARISAAIRPYDTLGRFGGEEFLIVLPRAKQVEAREVLERIRRAACDTPIEAEGYLITVSLSAGGASGRGAPTEELIRLADQALYRAKRSGRNRVSMAESSVARLRVV